MDDPWDLRDPQAPSERVIDAFVAGEATPEEAARVRAWCDGNPAAQAIVDARRAGFTALPMARAQVMRARVLLATEAPAEPPRPRRPWLRLGLVGGLGALAAAAAFVSLDPGVPPPEPVEVVRAKGGLVLQVFRDRAGAEEVLPGEPLAPGDRLRFRAGGLPAGGYVMVIGAEADGDLYALAPAGARAALPVAALQAETPDGQTLPGAAELDDSRGEEWAHLVWCPAPFGLADAGGGPQRLDLPRDCRTAAFGLRKP